MLRFVRRSHAVLMAVTLVILCTGLSARGDSGVEAAAVRADLEQVNFRALKMALQDLVKSFPSEYAHGKEYLREVESFESRLATVREGLDRHDPAAIGQARQMTALARKALLSNPLLDFDRLLLIRRKPLGDPRRARGDTDNDQGLGQFLGLPQQSSWQLQPMTNTSGWDNEIVVFSPVRPEGQLTTLFRPTEGQLVSDMDLHCNGSRIMFSMPDDQQLWQIFEFDIDTGKLRQISPANQPDVHNFDACYLPNDGIAFISSAPFQGVPCEVGVTAGMCYTTDRYGSSVRQVCFDQSSDFCPTVMNDGRILYLRWEQAGLPHVWARRLFTMNPDGTGQREFYGSGGYWPNAIFYARPIPNSPTKFVGIVTGHRVGRVGDLVLFDVALGRQSTEGVVQRIPGYGRKVEPVIEDKLTLDHWPKFLHPWPLSDKYFLVCCKPRPQDLWGIYLVDVFDNITLVKEVEGYALLEPIPLRKTPRLPMVADKVDLYNKDALMFVENVYAGPGLEGVPVGSVKRLRLFTYQFAYRGVAGPQNRVGMDGPWEPKRILGTVPVEKDGSAFFHVPANTPISLQPLDDQDRALQLMRSWTTAMPGELVSCTGCHEHQNSGTTSRRAMASRLKPAEIEPWRGPARGFSFEREVQPVLDKYCASCHNGTDGNDAAKPDLRRDQGRFVVCKNGDPHAQVVADVPREQLMKEYGGVFPPSYIALRSLVRIGGLESDLRLLAPGEFGAETSELVQMLRKGHHGVRLDEEAWDRILTWIDLNGPCYGTWQEVVGMERIRNDHERRIALRRLYGGKTDDPEVYPTVDSQPMEPLRPEPKPEAAAEHIQVPGWPFGLEEAHSRQAKQGEARRRVKLGAGTELTLVYIPAGEFVMGEARGEADERPPARVRINEPFWMSACEITNAQFARFDPSHDSRFQDKGGCMLDERDLGWPLNQPTQPVVRVSWKEAVAFCRWLSKQLGETVTLPTEAQWEWACRAGSDSAFSCGDPNTDFSQYANMADAMMRELAYDTRDRSVPDLVPRNDRFNDGRLVTAPVGSYRPNAWGLYDMHGNVWEWTRSTYAPYPYRADDGRNDLDESRDRVVRGGSWCDRPKRCRSAFRLSYPAWQKVYNVGFRIITEANHLAPPAAEGSRAP